MSFDLLAGVRVVEVALLAPDGLGQHLADLGADVVKIEHPQHGDYIRLVSPTAVGSDDGPSLMHLRMNRGKRSIALDLRSDQGREVFLELVRKSDVLIEGLRAGALASFGLTPDVLAEANPSLVFCSISGLGSYGPYAALPTHGVFYDAFAGVVDLERDPDDGGPRLPGEYGVPIGIHAAPLHAAMGVLAALVRARTTGEGASIEVAETDAALLFNPEPLEYRLNPGVIHRRASYGQGAGIRDSVRYSVYVTSDDKVILFQAAENKFWRNFLAAVDREDLLERYPTEGYDHAANNEELRKELAGIFRQRTRAEWTDLFVTADVPGGPVYAKGEAVDDRHFQARANTYLVDDPETGPLELAGTPLKVAGQLFSSAPAPYLGQHTEAVLREVLGYDDAAVSRYLGDLGAVPR